MMYIINKIPVKRSHRSDNHQSAFVLPTVLVLSVVLLTLGLSVFQLTSSIARSLTDQYWQRLAVQATQAGVSYLSACVDQGLGSGAWPDSITQDNNCLGVALGTQPSLYSNASDSNPIPNAYKSSFTIYKPITGPEGIPKARVVGSVAILNSLGNTIRTYTSEMTVIINGPTRSFSQTSGGGQHSCGLSGGQVYCWGLGVYGELGNGDSVDSSVPVAVYASGVLAGKTVTQVSAGHYSTCAIADGQVYCWGNNNYGQFGNGNTIASNTPVAVDTSGVLAGKTVTQIATGSQRTCALANGQVFCWGFNNLGQLGNNSTANSSVPVAVDTSGVLAGKTVTQIVAGASHTCALANGQVYCWGRGDFGQLGNNNTINSSVPVAVDTGGVLAGKSVTQITSSSDAGHTCALANGQAFCWGANGYGYGQLGNNTTANSSVPVAVDTSGVLGGKTVTQITAGSGHTCAIADGRAYCWGANSTTVSFGRHGQLGNNTTIGSIIPVAVYASGVLAGKTVTQITAGVDHTCAVADGQSYCWGANKYGQLGNAQTTDSLVPIKSTNTF